MDGKWWSIYASAVLAGFGGERVSAAPVRAVNSIGAVRHYSNSGAAAISLAAARGARRIVMVGFDCQRTGGMSHWHGDHIKQLGNAGSLPKWPEQFRKLAADIRRQGVSVINASRQTALTCFPRMALEQALEDS
jgi:hypothetical protein